MSASRVSSSWIGSIAYVRILEDGEFPHHARTPTRYLALFLRAEPGDEPVALLYAGDIPSYLPGLLAAGCGRRRSPGLAFNRLLKGKYSYQRVEGEERVRELKRLMEVGAEARS